ncbi:hypothetical protein [uncultured Cocleimonas sp.]|uniref:hypothetical protein n=1 Tax=uncultured Cocleimonas sp. TaxID=1051587 RepID=UPI00261B9639|nr:hypothetical protein [uncultured Cocleimonas sp.]
MKKEKVISIINSAIESHEVWVKHGQILIDGLNLDTAQAPLDCEDCEFHLWFNSNGTRLRNFSWYKEVNDIHTKFHKSYSVLYYESMRMYNPKTRAELIERFDDLNVHSNAYQKLLKEIHEELDDMIVADFEEKLVDEEVVIEEEHPSAADSKVTEDVKADTKATEDKNVAEKEDDHDSSHEHKSDSIEITPVNIEESHDQENDKQEVEELKADLAKPVEFNKTEKLDSPIDYLDNNNSELDIDDIPEDAILEMNASQHIPTVEINNNESAPVQGFVSTSSTDPYQQRQYLKQQDIKQIEQEIELTQLELNQFKERQKLTQQSIQQLEQYYLLKHQEMEINQREHTELETRKLEVKNLKEKELANLDQQARRKIQELDQLEMVDQKLEKKKEQSVTFEKQQIAQLDEQKANKLEDIKQIDKHLDLRQKDLQKLKDQVALVEQDIADLESQKEGKNKDLESIAEQKSIKIEQSELESQRQQKLDEHKAEVQKEKQQELNLLEQQQQLRKDELQAVKQELMDLGQKKTEVEVVKQREIRELEEQQSLKQDALKKIEENQQAKRQEIRELEIKQDLVKESLKEMQGHSDFHETV